MIEINKKRKALSKEYEKFFGDPPAFIASAPGRINIIGEHTDYNMGLAMPAGINRWVLIGLSFRDDFMINIYTENFDQKMKFKLGVEHHPKTSWEKYIYGTMQIFLRYASINKGFNAYIQSNIPHGTGVSSSGALEVAMMNLLRKAFNGDFDDLTLVKSCQKVEHDFLHVSSGLLDQYASQFSKKDKLMLLDFYDLSRQYVEADLTEWVWVLVNSKVERALPDSKYSERVDETKAALDILKKQKMDIQNFRDISKEDLELINKPILKKRIRHYITENQRVMETVPLLKKKDFEGVGNIMLASHYSLKNDYQVSCDELDFLVESARSFPDCAGTRMMGGGFGGCTINLIRKNTFDDFAEHITKAYKNEYHIEPEVTSYDVVDGAICE